MSACVIAEAAATHDGHLGRALELVDLAATIGANAVKFQWCSNPARLIERRRAPEYHDAYRLLAFPPSWFCHLVARCEALGLEFLCTVYLPEDVAAVAPHVRRFKAASFEATDAALLLVLAGHGKPLIVSLGMQSHSEIWDRYREVIRPGDAVLHCVSAYPAPPAAMNLRAIRALWMFGSLVEVGLSDHSRDLWTGALAVAVGADIVEFHVRLDETSPQNADYDVAFTPREAAQYVANLRRAETMLGDGIKRVTEAEAPWLRYRVTS